MNWTPEFATAVATVVIAAFTIVLAVGGSIQAFLTRQAINLARDEFNATHRPKLRVRRMKPQPYGKLKHLMRKAGERTIDATWNRSEPRSTTSRCKNAQTISGMQDMRHDKVITL